MKSAENNNTKYDDLLKNLVQIEQNYDTIELDEVLKIVNMKKRLKQAQALHPYEIHHTETSGWFTTVDDDTQPTGKRKIRRSTEESLWDALATWYIDNNKNMTLQDVYMKWIDWKQTPVNKDNIKRIQASWKAYYSNEPLSENIINKPMSKITTLALREWAESL